MAKIIINEVDLTSNAVAEYSNFAVVIPGKIGASCDEAATFDENGIATFTSYDAFITAIDYESITEKTSLGHILAAELLNIGYTVYYYNLGKVEEEGEPSTSTISESAIKALTDKSLYDFRYLMSGYLTDNAELNNQLSEIATTRGDCIALIDIDENIYTDNKTQDKAISAIKTEVSTNLTKADKYTFIFTPAVKYQNKAFKDTSVNDIFIPLSFHYLACAAEVEAKNIPEWFAIANLSRGTSSKYKIVSTSVKLGVAASDELNPKKRWTDEKGKTPVTGTKSVNIACKVNGVYCIYSNRTAAELEFDEENGQEKGLLASHYANIRQLCTTLKKYIYATCRKYTFDPNSLILWTKISGELSTILERMKLNQGIEEYTLKRIEDAGRGEFKAQIDIVPIEAVEDFLIDLILTDSVAVEEEY